MDSPVLDLLCGFFDTLRKGWMRVHRESQIVDM
jgi:hypothetical protein